MNILKHSALRDQWELHCFVQTLRWDSLTSTDIMATLNTYQTASGFVASVMEVPEIPIDYLYNGWIPHLRRRLNARHGRFIRLRKLGSQDSNIYMISH